MPIKLDAPDNVEVVLSSFTDLSEARSASREFATDHGAAGDDPYTASLIVNELATNALQAHESDNLDGPVKLGLTWIAHSATILIEVRDLSPRVPLIAGPTVNTDREGGRGLDLVRAYCADLGWECFEGSKVVWARYKVAAV